VRARLLAAAALCALALGLGWTYNAGSAGYSMGGYAYRYQYDSAAGGYVNEMTYVPGLYYYAGHGPAVLPGASSDARVVLVPTIAGLAWAADPRRRRARSVARAAGAGLVVLITLALSRGMAAAALATGGALALAWPALGWGRPAIHRHLHAPTAPASSGAQPAGSGTAF
jgi:hypothetical protein